MQDKMTRTEPSKTAFFEISENKINKDIQLSDDAKKFVAEEAQNEFKKFIQEKLQVTIASNRFNHIFNENPYLSEKATLQKRL